ncbi:MAG: hypothetical protein WCS37_21170 [Chloroflexota bacterium]|nr:hypothetical protein [Chloroflexota bacterium]
MINTLLNRTCLLLAALVICLISNVTLPSLALASARAASFYELWSRTDDLVYTGAVSRSWVWGPKILENTYKDKYRLNGTNYYGTRIFRQYDKGRMEIDLRADPDSKWFIRGGTLVKEMVVGRIQVSEDGETSALNPLDLTTPAQIPVVGDPASTSNTPTYATFTNYSSITGYRSPDQRGQSVAKLINRAGDLVQYDSGDPKAVLENYESATGHNIPRAFVEYFNKRGLVLDENGNQVTENLFDPIYLFGYPITEPYWARVMVGGKSTLVMLQLFERRILSYTPTNAPEWQVEMGNVGQHYLAWRIQHELTFTGPPRISLEKFTSVLESYNSPVVPEATDLYNTLTTYSLDPGVALGFFVNESSAGTASGYCNGQNSLSNKNWGNVRGEEDGACGFQSFPTWKAGLETWCRLMIKYYVNRDLNHLEDAIPIYAPSSDGNDPPAYIATMYKLLLRWQGYRI